MTGVQTCALPISNVEQHKITDRVSVIESDLLVSIPENSVDFVLSNPPYVSETEYAKLDKTVREHEPRMALVGGVSGTEIIERLAFQAADKLVENGWFICELSPMIADQVESHMASTQNWTNITIIKDLARLKRLVVAQRRKV